MTLSGVVLSAIPSIFGVMVGAIATYCANIVLKNKEISVQISTARSVLQKILKADADFLGGFAVLHNKTTQNTKSRMELRSYLLLDKDLILPAIQSPPGIKGLPDGTIEEIIKALHLSATATLIAEQGSNADVLSSTLNGASKACNDAAGLLAQIKSVNCCKFWCR